MSQINLNNVGFNSLIPSPCSSGKPRSSGKGSRICSKPGRGLRRLREEVALQDNLKSVMGPTSLLKEEGQIDRLYKQIERGKSEENLFLVVHRYMILADRVHMMGYQEMAMRLYEKSWRVFRKINNPNSLEIEQFYSHLITQYGQLNSERVQQAYLELLDSLLDALEKAKRPPHLVRPGLEPVPQEMIDRLIERNIPDLTVKYIRVATVLDKLGQTDRAEEYYSEALNLLESASDYMWEVNSRPELYMLSPEFQLVLLKGRLGKKDEVLSLVKSKVDGFFEAYKEWDYDPLLMPYIPCLCLYAGLLEDQDLHDRIWQTGVEMYDRIVEKFGGESPFITDAIHGRESNDPRGFVIGEMLKAYKSACMSQDTAAASEFLYFRRSAYLDYWELED